MRQVFYNTGKIISKIMMIVAVGLEAVGFTFRPESHSTIVQYFGFLQI